MGGYRRAGKNFQDEISKIQRYLETSYTVGSLIGAADATGAVGSVGNVVAAAGSNTFYVECRWKTVKRVSPSVTVYSSSNGASGNIQNASTGNNVATAVATGIGTHGMRNIQINSATNPVNTGNAISFHFKADARL